MTNTRDAYEIDVLPDVEKRTKGSVPPRPRKPRRRSGLHSAANRKRRTKRRASADGKRRRTSGDSVRSKSAKTHRSTSERQTNVRQQHKKKRRSQPENNRGPRREPLSRQRQRQRQRRRPTRRSATTLSTRSALAAAAHRAPPIEVADLWIKIRSLLTPTAIFEAIYMQIGAIAPRTRRTVMRSELPVTAEGRRLATQLTVMIGGLTLFGLVMVLSASAVFSTVFLDSPFFQFKRQLAWAAIGMALFLAFSRIDYRRLRMVIGPFLLFCATLMVAVLIPGIGTTTAGSTRWLQVGPILMQPAELVKFAVIVAAADLLARRERRMNHADLTVRPVMLLVIFFSALLLLQPKLGTGIILGAIAILMLFVAGAPWKNLVGWVSVAAVAVAVLSWMAPYRRARLLIFRDPWVDPEGSGYQLIQSQISISSGGWLGVGLGASRAKWGYLPTSQSDFIFAIVAEELGLIGASLVIAGFVAIGWLGLRTALTAPDRFGMLLAAGVTCWILVQAFLNIGMVMSVLPTTGEPLPFVSAGGSSLMTVLAAAGFLTSVARRSQVEKAR